MGYCSILGNCSVFNNASCDYSFTGGGYFNNNYGCYSFIGAGQCNGVNANFQTLTGGKGNCLGYCYPYGVIGGGLFNLASAGTCTAVGIVIAGGIGNSTCGGTWDNYSNCWSMPPSSQCMGAQSFIGGGFQNTAICCQSIVVGGCCNTNCSAGGFIGGGYSNHLEGYCGVLTGGVCNSVCGYGFANILDGGYCNTIKQGSYSFIGGGCNNMIGCNNYNACFNNIVGGAKGYIDGQFGFIGNSGDCNVYGYCSTNKIECQTYGASILNGVSNTICGNFSFGCNNFFGTILGGCCNTVTCDYGLAFGCGAYAGYPFTTVIGCNLYGFSGCTMYVNNMCVCGNLSKMGGSFRIPHPDPAKPTKDLIHSFVESPTAGENLYRYSITTCNCTAAIELPEYYKFLNCDDQVFVTPKNHFGAAYGVINEEQTSLSLCSNADGEYNVLIIGTRKDDHAMNYWKGAEVDQITGSIQQ
jgi:hypothetical protein